MVWSLGVLQPSLPDAMLGALDGVVAERMLHQLGGVPPALGQPAANFVWGLAQLRLAPLQGRCARPKVASPARLLLSMQGSAAASAQAAAPPQTVLSSPHCAAAHSCACAGPVHLHSAGSLCVLHCH